MNDFEKITERIIVALMEMKGYSRCEAEDEAKRMANLLDLMGYSDEALLLKEEDDFRSVVQDIYGKSSDRHTLILQKAYQVS